MAHETAGTKFAFLRQHSDGVSLTNIVAGARVSLRALSAGRHSSALSQRHMGWHVSAGVIATRGGHLKVG